MKLYSLLNENNVLTGEAVDSMEAALHRMLASFPDLFEDEQVREQVVGDLMERERQHPTLITQGVYLPHMRREGQDRFLLGLLVPERPVPHPNPDLPPMALMFVILAPQDKNTMMLQTLAAIARLLQSREIYQAMLKVRAPARLLRFVEESGIEVKKTLVAADIMQPAAQTLRLSMILAKAVDVLVASPDEGLPVLDDQNRLVGELTSRELLRLGMPKYLDLIVNPAMLENFEPFENFFRHENTTSVGEVCRRDIVTVAPNAPVVQLTHLMMTHHKRRIYVVDDGELKGVIYRKEIIARVFHF